VSEKRMFSKQIVESDAFLDMPLSTQALYFHLGMAADDDGFINAPKRIQRGIGSSDDDLKLLITKNFVIPFETGVVVIKHWLINNYIRKDRKRDTAYPEEMSKLAIKDNGAYRLATDRQLTGNCPASGSVDKNSIDKYKLSSSSKGGKVNLLKMMTDDEISALFSTYEDADYLIDAVEDDINRKLKGAEIYDAFRYVIGYATKKGWPENEQQTQR